MLKTSDDGGIGSSSFIRKVCRMINWILLATHSPILSLFLSLPLPLFLFVSLFLSHTPFLSPSPPPGPLASRRGDRIISEAFARFLPPSPSSVLFLPERRGESLIIVTGHGASSFTYSVELVSSRSLPSYPLLHPRLLARPLASTRVLSLLSACAVFPCALPTLQYTLSICLLRSEKMKKGGVAREIKGCRRRCLHHPAPTNAGKRGAKGANEREREREREKEDRRDERHTHTHTHDTPRSQCRTTQRTVPHTTHTPHRAGTRARWYARHTLSSPLAARVTKARRANHANALRYSPRSWIYAGYHT